MEIIMKKLLMPSIAMCLLAQPFVASADSKLYGEFRYSLNSVDDNVSDGLTATDNTSLLGIKGWYGDEIKAFYHLQMGAKTDSNSITDTTIDGTTSKTINPNDTTLDGTTSTDVSSANIALGQRFFFAGLKGGFGKIAYGRMTNAYKFAGFANDPLYNTAGIGANGNFGGGGATYGLSGATNGFTDNSLQYSSPKIAGMLTLNAGVYIDDSNADEHGTNIGAKINMSGFLAGIQFASNGTTVVTLPGIVANGDATRIYLGYKAKAFKAFLSVENVDTSATQDTQYVHLTGTYNFTKWNTLTVSLGTVDNGSAKGSGINVGYFHKVAPKTKVFGTLGSVSLKNQTKDATSLSLGVSHKFSVGGS
jgi:hypothetical protein